MQNWKKAIVTLKEGDSIDFFSDASERRSSHGNQELQADVAGPALLLGRRTSRRSPRTREPLRALIEHQTRTGGRNHYGRITSRFRGGGHKQRYRIIDWKRDKIGVPAMVATIEYDPNRTARIALLHYVDGEKRYILAPDGLKVGDTIVSSRNADIKPGNSLTLRHIPLGTMIHNIELKKGKGGQLVRSAGVGRRAHGEGRRLRAGPPALRRGPHGPPRVPRHHRPGLEPRPREHLASARPGARAGSGAARTTAASP